MPIITEIQLDQEICQEIGSRLKAYRLQQNRTIAAVAQRAGLNRNTVLNAERGLNPGLETIVKILRVLGRLDALEGFLPPPGLSPLQLIAMRGKPRRRASRSRHG